MEELTSQLITWVSTTGIKVVISIVILLISFAIINHVCDKLTSSLEKQKKLDITLTRTFGYVSKVALKGLVIICLIGYLGIETSGISAVIASLGVCAGLAVNGTLSNLAGGVMLLITRPFSVGDYISAQGVEGTVENIFICNTTVVTIDNKVIYLPNSALSTGNITNFSQKPTRRIDMTFSIAGNNPAVVRSILLDICADDKRILPDPAPFCRVTDFGAGNGVKMQLRAWCKTAEYWDIYLDILDRAQETFEAKNIVVPFDQLDVHVKEK